MSAAWGRHHLKALNEALGCIEQAAGILRACGLGLGEIDIFPRTGEEAPDRIARLVEARYRAWGFTTEDCAPLVEGEE
jgi:hypothetical protein